MSANFIDFKTKEIPKLRKQFKKLSKNDKEKIFAQWERRVRNFLHSNEEKRSAKYKNMLNNFASIADFPVCIKSSKGRGWGLFARKEIKQSNKPITLFQIGTPNLDTLNGKKLRTNPTDVRKLAQFVNEKVQGKHAEDHSNVLLRTHAFQLCIKMHPDVDKIKRGQELFTHYGNTYYNEI